MKWSEALALGIVGALILSILYLPKPAHKIRLIGQCAGEFYGGIEEDQFPDGCAWVEPVRLDVE